MIQFDASFLVIMVIFWATYLVARKLIFLPVSQLLQERAAEVDAAQEVYTQALAHSEAELEKQKARLSEALISARAERDEVRKDALNQRAAIVAKAKREAEANLVAARSELDQTVTEERQRLASLVDSLADQMASKLLRRAS